MDSSLADQSFNVPVIGFIMIEWFSREMCRFVTAIFASLKKIGSHEKNVKKVDEASPSD